MNFDPKQIFTKQEFFGYIHSLSSFCLIDQLRIVFPFVLHLPWLNYRYSILYRHALSQFLHILVSIDWSGDHSQLTLSPLLPLPHYLLIIQLYTYLLAFYNLSFIRSAEEFFQFRGWKLAFISSHSSHVQIHLQWRHYYTIFWLWEMSAIVLRKVTDKMLLSFTLSLTEKKCWRQENVLLIAMNTIVFS